MAKHVLKENDLIVVSFQIPDGSLISVRGRVRNLFDDGKDAGLRYGIQFENLEFQYKRELRNFVAAATQESIFA